MTHTAVERKRFRRVTGFIKRQRTELSDKVTGARRRKLLKDAEQSTCQTRDVSK